MPFLLQYLFKLSLTLAVLYLFYYILLRKLTFYTWNRFYLLCYTLVSFLIPFINVTPWIQDKPIATSSLVNGVSFIGRLNSPAAAPVAAGGVSFFSPYDMVLLLFAGGAVAMLIRLLLQFLSIQAIKRRAVLIHTNNVRLYDVDSPISPFSFAQSIFINTRQYSEEDLQKIIQHEFVHVKQQHTVDLLVGELLCVINWYNPFAWLIRKAIRQNLEFIADHSVLQTGLDARQYQYLLLQVTGLPKYSVTNNFNISSLKKRIFMMNKLQSARVHLLRFLFMLPLVALILLAFRGQQIDKQKAHLLQNKDLAYDTVPPKPPLPPAAPVNPHMATPPLPPPPPPVPRAVKSILIDAATNQATVMLKNGKKEVYDLTSSSERAMYEKKYALIPPPPPPARPGEPEVIDVWLGDTTRGMKAIYRDREEYYRDQEKLYKTKEDNYRKKEDAYRTKEKLYKEKEDAYGKKEKLYSNNENIYITADSIFFKERSSSDVLPPSYIINGVVSSAADFSKIDPGQIESITVLKGEEAIRLYGEKTMYGVMIVSTRGGKVVHDTGSISFRVVEDINSLNNYKGIVIINGKEASKADVESMFAAFRKNPFMYSLEMTALKREEAVRKWGDRGKEGVMIINFQSKDM